MRAFKAINASCDRKSKINFQMIKKKIVKFEAPHLFAYSSASCYAPFYHQRFRNKRRMLDNEKNAALKLLKFHYIIPV